MRKIAVFGAALWLSGCVGATPDQSDIGPRPDNYREIVAAQVKAEFFDPSSMQDVYLAEPYPARFYFTDGWMVCLRANAKNRMGGYTGQQETGYLIKNGTIVQEGDQKNCPDAKYEEWKEMEGAGWKH